LLDKFTKVTQNGGIMKPIAKFQQGFFFSAILTGGLLAGALQSQGASMLFNINANGIKEVNISGVPAGDPDGTATGTILVDDGTGGTTGFAVFNLTLANLDTPFSAHHFHMAPPTTTGAVFLGFGNPETIRTGNQIAGTVSGLSSSLIDSVFANPTAFYYNLHNTPFPGGAVRDQLAVPEPSTVCLGILAIALGAAVKYRRSKKSA
jgi:hypothetical protein